MELPTFVVESLREKDEDTGEPLYWSNAEGWVDLANATYFKIEEANSVNLPIGGVWVRAPEMKG